jgi:hypothetical protein
VSSEAEIDRDGRYPTTRRVEGAEVPEDDERRRIIECARTLLSYPYVPSLSYNTTKSTPSAAP